MNHMEGNVRRRIQRRAEQGMERSLSSKRLQQLREFLQKKSDRINLQTRKTVRSRFNSQSGVHQIEFTLPDDLFFKIFLLLPAESLCRLQFVCKKWFDLINSPVFIEFHTQQTETVLISRELLLYESPRPVLALPLIGPVRPPSIEKPTPFFHFVDFDEGNDNFIQSSSVDLVNVHASCNGLILGTTKNNHNLMIVMNPLTRKYTKIPSGTIGFDECYSLLFCGQARTYKVVHLFREKSGYTGCEIFDITTRKWTFMDGPSSSLLEDVRQMPVSVGGSLFWMPKRHGGEVYLSMNVGDGIFVNKNLPVTSAENDRLIEFGGVLGFVTFATLDIIHVWILTKSIGGGEEKWIKRYCIYERFVFRRYLPICSSRNGKEIVFEFVGGDLYAYDLTKGVMKKICSRHDEMNHRHGAEKLFIPHRNTLASWD